MDNGMPKKTPTVLLVDDETVGLRVLASALHAFLGWDILTAVGPVAAAKLYDKADVVVTDWVMPDGGGARVLAECNRPVLVISAAEGIDHPHCLPKPVSVKAVVHALEGLTKGWSRI